MGLTERTIKYHMGRILEMLHLENRAQVIAYATKMGIVEDVKEGKQEIADIPSYNRANGVMWLVYTLCMVVTGILSLFNIMAGVVSLIVVCIPGIGVLIFAYQRIYNKYKR